MSISYYHELRKASPRRARELVRKVLDKNNGNVSVSAQVLGISRNSVRRARDGSLDDVSRKPHNCPSKTPDKFEKLILLESQRTGFRYRRLSLYMQRKYSLPISENTIKAILKRNNLPRRSRRSASVPHTIKKPNFRSRRGNGKQSKKKLLASPTAKLPVESIL